MSQSPPKIRGPLTRLADRTWRFWAVVVLFPVLYVGSFGPAYWWQHSSDSRIVTIVYAPLVELAWHFPNPLMDLGWAYANCGVSDNGKRLAWAPLWHDAARPSGPMSLFWFDPTAIAAQAPAAPTPTD